MADDWAVRAAGDATRTAGLDLCSILSNDNISDNSSVEVSDGDGTGLHDWSHLDSNGVALRGLLLGKGKSGGGEGEDGGELHTGCCRLGGSTKGPARMGEPLYAPNPYQEALDE